MGDVRTRSPDTSRMSYATISTTSYISRILRLLAAPGTVPIGRPTCGTYACMIQYTVVRFVELRSASGYFFRPGTASASLGPRCRIRISPVWQLRFLDIDIDTFSTCSRNSLRVTPPLTKLPPEPVHLDLELGKLAAFCIQPIR
jgi:hypothetical protein